MRVVNKPNISPVRAYVRCYSSFRPATKTKYRNITTYISSQSIDYDQKATNKILYTIPVTNTAIIAGSITKEDMTKLYNTKLVGHKTGRKIYDKLMSLIPLSKCPFCGIGVITTLDHYLPEAKFPTFSVLPYNLVASCKDCNTGKLASFSSTQNEQTLHPYYDDYTKEQWLYAKVLQTTPVSIEFYVKTPEKWNQVDKDRVKTHFKNYQLAKRYSIEASNVLADLKSEFLLFNTKTVDIQIELKKKFRVFYSKYKNSWETAMYQALYKNQWYCTKGYAL